MSARRYYVRVTAPNGEEFVDVARSREVALVFAAEARRHGDRGEVLASTWHDGRWSDAILETVSQ